MTKEDELIEVYCNKCGSSNVYTTLSERCCRRCGHRENLDGKEKKRKKD